MMSTLTFIIITGAAIIALWIAWEGYAIWTGKKTITVVVREMGMAGASLISLVIGLLIGHFWL